MHIDHVVLWVADPLASVAFFTDVLGLEGVRVEDYKAKRCPFPSVRLSAHSILDLMAKSTAPMVDMVSGKPGSAGHLVNHVCLAMTKAEYDTLVQRLEARGTPPQRPLENSFGAQGPAPKAFYFTDPDGNVLEARYYE